MAATMYNDVITAIEDASVITGNVTATDNNGNAILLSYVLNEPAPEGLIFNIDGSYLFDPSAAAYQSLGMGQQFVLNIPYTATDNQGVSSVANMVINITGINDAPVAQTAFVAIFEDTAIVSSVGATDVDANTTLNYALKEPAPDGLTFYSDGSYSFEANVAAYQSLGAGQQVVLTVPYVVADQSTFSTANLVITVTGTNDVPVAQVAVNTVAEDTVIFGNVTATDVDGNATLSYSLDAPAPAGLTFNPDGSYSFDASVAAYQSLDVGQQAVLNMTYTATDDQGATSVANLVITVIGTNDAPVAQAVVNTIVEDTIIIGYVTATDVDANAILSYALNTPAPAGLTFNNDGSYRFDASIADYQSLGEGQQAVLNVAYTATDEQGTSSVANLMLAVVGTNDIPVAQAAVNAVFEDATIIGNVTATDADGNAILSYALNAPAPSGLTFNADGSYHFDASVADYQSMFAGQQVGLNVAYTATDDQGATSVANLMIMVTGINDAPVAQAAVNTVVEDTVIFGNVTATDVDANATLSYALNAPAPAGLSFSSDGSYLFDVSVAAYQSLSEGQQTLLSVAYTATDDQGATSVANLTLNINGANDTPTAPVFTSAIANDILVIDGVLGHFASTDVDSADTLVYSGGSVDANSQLTVLANGDLKLNAVPSTATGSLNFTASVSDGHGGASDSIVYNLFLGTNTDDAINGSSGNIDEYFFAGNGNDTVNAGNGNDVIFGQAGNDILNGETGNDTLTGGLGSDTFVFDTALLTTNIDTITDFQSGTDHIQLAASIFSAFTAGVSVGVIDAGLGSSGGNYMVYDNVNGDLYYDANGGTHDDAVQVAIIGSPTHPGTVLSSDFIVA